MFCPKCGSEVAANSKFCPKCGAPQAAAPTPASEPPVGEELSSQPAPPSDVPPMPPAPKKVSTKMVGIGIGVIAVVLVAVLAFFVVPGCTGGSATSVVDSYVKASFEGDTRAIWNLIIPEMRDAAIEQSGMDEDELVDDLDEMLSYIIEYADDYLGEGWTYTYEVTDEDDMSSRDLDDFEEQCSDYYDFEIDVTEGKEFEVEVTITSADGEDEETSDMNVTVVKTGGKWYLAQYY